MDQIEKAVHTIERMGDVRQRGRMFEHLGLPKELANASIGEVDKFLADIRSHLKPLTSGDIAGGRQADQAFAGLREQIESLRDEIGKDFVPEVTKAVKVVNDFVAANDKIIDSGLKDWFNDAATAAKGLKAVLQPVVDILNKLTGWQNSLAPWMHEHVWSHLEGLGAPPGTQPGGEATPIPWGQIFDDSGATRPGQIADDLRRRREQFDKLNPGGGLFHPSAYRVEGGQDLRGGGSGDAIAMIAAGTRKGVYDGLWDFYQSFRGGGADGVGGGAGGILRASWGTGGRGGGDGFGGGLPGHGAGGEQGTDVAPPGAPGTYRPVYKLGDHDLSDAVVNTIAGEASTKNPGAIDAVIDNMFNRLGTKGYGPSGNLEQVARAKGQYTGWRQATAKEAELIRNRIRAIASGGVPDATGGSNEYRASWYHGPWGWRHPDGRNIGGNVFAYNPKGGVGPYGPYPYAHLVDHPVVKAMHGAALRAHFGHRTPLHSQEVDAGGLLRASRWVDLAALHKVTGEASLKVALGPGLVPVGGVNTKGDLFKEIHLDRGAVAYI